VILAHNASFDMSVLRAVLDLYGLPWPEMSYLCTVKIAQQTWPGLDNHKLPTVADHLGLYLEHHLASSDAEACANIALAAARQIKANDIASLSDQIGVTKGIMAAGYYQPCSSPARKPRQKPLLQAIQVGSTA
jgi:DNA polymerase III subunit epsilon